MIRQRRIRAGKGLIAKYDEKLWLYNNQIGDKGGSELGKGLAQSTTIKELYLSNNQIGDKGGSELGKGLAQSKTITKLYL